MSTELTIPPLAATPTDSLKERIEGTPLSRVVAEFVSTSALFPILDAIRVITADGWLHYLQEPSHYVLLGAAMVQAWFLGTAKSNRWTVRFVGNLLGFGLYAPLDMVIEGVDFFKQPYHWLFGAFSLLMAIFCALQVLAGEHRWRLATVTLLLNITKVALFPAMYFITELNLTVYSQLTWAAWQEYMQSSGHRFIFYGALFFGALLGLAEAQRINYASFLRRLSHRLKQYSEWSFSRDLVANAIDNPNALELRRVEKTMLFMDIRGFTAWSEQTDPRTVVDMLNKFYNAAEQVISQHHGHKPNFTADEIMTRFASAQAALEASVALQQTLGPLLAPLNLAVGIGLNTGEIIEGLMGSNSTRKYDIIGDAVNTAKRLESAAGMGEILMSMTTFQALSYPPRQTTPRTLQVKGKSQPLQAVAIKI